MLYGTEETGPTNPRQRVARDWRRVPGMPGDASLTASRPSSVREQARNAFPASPDRTRSPSSVLTRSKQTRQEPGRPRDLHPKQHRIHLRTSENTTVREKRSVPCLPNRPLIRSLASDRQKAADVVDEVPGNASILRLTDFYDFHAAARRIHRIA
jgi:hypothetical protein